MVTNQHQPNDCPELRDELSSHYEAMHRPVVWNIWCNCGSGAHRAWFLVEASGLAETMRTVPAGVLLAGTT